MEHDTRAAILDRLARVDTPTLVGVDALLRASTRSDPADSGKRYLAYLRAVADSDVSGLIRAEASYGDSWKRRGGVGAYSMLTRKWDRLEGRVAAARDDGAGRRATAYDIFEHIAINQRADGIIDDVRDLRRYLLLIEAEMTARVATGGADSGRAYLDQLRPIADGDVQNIEAKEPSHGSSWKQRAGIGAFMMLARKWDRMRQRIELWLDATGDTPGASRGDVFEHIAADRRVEGVLDDVRDLRRFLLLVEAEMAARGAVTIGTARDNRDPV